MEAKPLACYCNRFWTRYCFPDLVLVCFCCSKGLCIWRSVKGKKNQGVVDKIQIDVN